MPYPMNDYVKWVAKEVLTPVPADLTRDWVGGWRDIYEFLIARKAVFELISMVTSRWEVLGALHRGTVGHSGFEDAVSFADGFLDPSAKYRQLHDLAGQSLDANGNLNGSDFFTMLRSKPLHGLTPAGAACAGDAEVVVWWVGVDEISEADHLTLDGRGRLQIDGKRLAEEFVVGAEKYVAQLRDDVAVVDGRTPSARWRRGFWGRFKPRHFHGDWTAIGETNGLPK